MYVPKFYYISLQFNFLIRRILCWKHQFMFLHCLRPLLWSCALYSGVLLWWNTQERLSGSYFAEGHKLEWRSRTVFADIGITNTSSLTKFWVSLCILEPIFLYKNSIVYTYGNVCVAGSICKTYSIRILSICHQMVITL